MKINAFEPREPNYWLSPKILLVMKITGFLVLIVLMSASAATRAQKITLSEKNTPLKVVLDKIRLQSGYDFISSSKLLESADPVTVEVTGESIEAVLKMVFEHQELTYEIENKTVLIERKEMSFMDHIIAHFKEIDVNGRIVDEKGKPLLGANVIIKGINRSATTDKDGLFSFKGVDEKAILVVSFIGFETLEIQASKINGSVVLKTKNSSLDEVTVTTAYGIERNKKELGYSTAKVTGDELNRANSGSILNGLVGKVSGLNIMTESSEMTPKMRILLRGIRSFGQDSNNQPLFVFNGAPLSFGSDLDAADRAVEFINNLNPADIEDVTILKGANGTAMYGPEGVNGVIIITTKKVKAGQVSANARVNTSYTQIDFRQRTDQRTFGGGDDPGTFGGKSTNSWGPAYNGSMISIGYPDVNGQYQKVPYVDLNDRYNFFNIARTTRTNVSLSQADATSSLYLGVGYVDQTGLLPGDMQNQVTAFLNSNKKLGKSANIQFNVNYANASSDRGPDVTSQVLNIPSYIPLLSYKDYQNSYWGSVDNYWSGINPYTTLANNRQTQNDNTITGSITLNVNVLPWLSVKNQVSINYLARTKKNNTEPVTFSDFAKVDPLKSTNVQPHTLDYMLDAMSVNNDLLVSALQKTGDFVLRGNLGGTVRANADKQLQTQATLVIPVFNDIYYRSDYGIAGDELTTQSRSLSALGNFSIGYKDKMFLELTGRNDWDSRRAKDARGKDFYFGANSSLVLKEMVPFLKDQKWLSTFRLRLSATRTANMNIKPQASEQILNLIYPYPITNAATGNSILGYGIFSKPNAEIKPEKVFSQEYGTEIGVMNNRIRLDASYYHQVNDGVIMAVAVPAYSGYPDLDNAGLFRNTGWEFDLNLNPLVNLGKDFSISLTGRLAINNNMVLKVSDIYKGTFIARDPNGNPFYAREGHSAFEFPVFDFIRDPEGRVVVDKTSGLPTVDYTNPKIMGQTLPVYQGGVTLNLVYKGFTLSSQADYSAGNDHLYSPTPILDGTSTLTLLNNRQVFVFPNSVIQDSPGHYIPNTNVAVSNAGKDLYSRFAAATINSLSSANYWKIREIALQYEMPVKSKWIKRMAISVYGRDLFSFYPHSNIYGDPVASNGPGLPLVQPQAIGSRPPSQSNNVSGGAADTNTAPGTVLYGFTFGLTF